MPPVDGDSSLSNELLPKKGAQDDKKELPPPKKSADPGPPEKDDPGPPKQDDPPKPKEKKHFVKSGPPKAAASKAAAPPPKKAADDPKGRDASDPEKLREFALRFALYFPRHHNMCLPYLHCPSFTACPQARAPQALVSTVVIDQGWYSTEGRSSENARKD